MLLMPPDIPVNRLKSLEQYYPAIFQYPMNGGSSVVIAKIIATIDGSNEKKLGSYIPFSVNLN